MLSLGGFLPLHVAVALKKTWSDSAVEDACGKVERVESREPSAEQYTSQTFAGVNWRASETGQRVTTGT